MILMKPSACLFVVMIFVGFLSWLFQRVKDVECGAGGEDDKDEC